MNRRKSHAADGPQRQVLTAGRIVAAVLAVAAVVFVVENTRQVKVRLLVPEVTLPLWTALLAMALIGWVCGALWFARRR